VRTGDFITLDVPNRRVTLEVSDAELTERRQAWQPATPRFDRGYVKLYVDHVLQAPQGCDFDFLRGAGRSGDRRYARIAEGKDD